MPNSMPASLQQSPLDAPDLESHLELFNLAHPGKFYEERSCLSLVDQIAQGLTERILSGALKGGDRLNEEQLKQEFGVSRTPLREAFRVLDKNGLVEVLPRKGVFVKRITAQDIRDNFPVRAQLEGLAAALAHSHLTREELEQMEAAFRIMQHSAGENDFQKFAAHHRILHEIFINASGNQVLIALLSRLRMHTLWHRYTFRYYQHDFKKSLDVHRRIIDCFHDRQTSRQALEALVRDHIETAMDPFLKAMQALEGTPHTGGRP